MMRVLLRFALPAVMAALLVACDRGGSPAPAPTSTSGTATATASKTATVTASTTPSPSTSPTPRSTPTPLATGPIGYATSCAAEFPWGKQVTKAFVCIELPQKGASAARGVSLVVRGYAGGSFENNVVVEVRTVDASGALGAAPLVLKPVTYTAPDMGMPGFWAVELLVPVGPPSNARVIAHFESPKDGARVAEASVDITLR
ncbi:MAG: hypothetical protein EPO65_07950 [Dehalococcoidia bacterium]|nr:MAG: hypothetical protein EPO65_07950 [Dehalococcoidia bacterium]